MPWIKLIIAWYGGWVSGMATISFFIKPPTMENITLDVAFFCATALITTAYTVYNTLRS